MLYIPTNINETTTTITTAYFNFLDILPQYFYATVNCITVKSIKIVDFLTICITILYIMYLCMQPAQLKELEREVRTFAVTNYILNKLRKHGINDITNLKLQKVLYIAYGLHLCLFESG